MPNLVQQWPKRDNKVKRVDVRAQLEMYNRSGFTDILAHFMQCRPTLENTIQWANQYPDRWANAMSIVAKLAGFSEKLEITNNLNINIGSMSDAQLLQQLQETRDKLQVSQEQKPIAIESDHAVVTIDNKP